MSILFRQGLENCILPKDSSADSKDFLRENFDIFGHRVISFSFFTNYSQRGWQSIFLPAHSTVLNEKNHWKICFFSKLSGKISAYCCQFLAPVFKRAGESARVLVFLTSCRICILRVQQNLSKSFFQAQLLFFIIFGHRAQSLWLSVKLFPVGLSELLSSCPKEKKGEFCFISESFYFLSFSDIEQKKSVSASQISVMLSKMVSMCQDEPYEEENFLIRKKYSFVHLGHWTYKFWPLPEILVLVCLSCILHSLRKFSRKCLKWFLFLILGHCAKIFRRSAKKVAESSKMQSAYPEKYLASRFWEKCFLIVFGHWVKIFRAFVNEFLARFSKVQFTYTHDEFGGNTFLEKV